MRYIAHTGEPVKPMTETERRIVRKYLTRVLDDLGNPGPSRFLVMFQDEERAKEEAKKKGLELLTPRAACELFEKSPSTVRRAVADGSIYALFTMRLIARPASLIDLDSAIRNWGKAENQLLDKMRTNGRVIGIGGDTYNILSPEPLVSPYKKGERE